ncbi:MAG: hypothetical protein GTO30_21000 [Acidobacteria bacterium]|nr:hypothetical protein [Acidobacteriota bacterium]NIM64033.1 hypothetical protein [Acidobacteriota bacterium]NIQ85350.1 hypothetical protein [Acidobacteriota bacterium]NIT11097.1 hypothetical protein [Acidobacteriota bacterium]
MDRPTQPLYFVGGEFKRGAARKAEWHRAKRARIVRVDPADGSIEECVGYVSPPDVCPDDDPSIVFKAGAVEGDRYYVCTHTEVLIYRLPDFERVGYVTHPWFNDMHHVAPSGNGTLLAVLTGLDMIVEISLEGEVVREWSVLQKDPWQRFDRSTDYRKVSTTKPHESHPNYVFRVDDQLWATRFEQRDAICLDDPERRIDIGIEKPHDGHVFDDKVYFTTVDGHVVVGDPSSGELTRVCDLNAIEQTDKALGWCRGLHPLDADHVLVCFSRIRPTKIAENLRWLQHKLGGRANSGSLPTRVALFNIRESRKLWEYELEPFDINVVYSVFVADTD